ncbi:hypothetical protein ACKGJY_12745 [Hyunsoonleella sp. 2307UL5-6]|uniref:hypothetical protein n=1 Tax=Hyunsoonleella sp. 2307UL5-6 TaxID=3384768 RepID=UPI0039BCF72C
MATAKKFTKVKVGIDTIPMASVFVSQMEGKNILKKTLRNFNYDTIISASFCVEYSEYDNNWLVDKSNIKYAGIYYVNDNTLKFDFHNLETNEVDTYNTLSDAYCDVILVFLLEDVELEKPALFELKLEKDNLPKQSSVKLASKSEDILYQRWVKFYEKNK